MSPTLPRGPVDTSTWLTGWDNVPTHVEAESAIGNRLSALYSLLSDVLPAAGSVPVSSPA